MGIKRTRPLMIDSHSTLTNINDNLFNEDLSSISNNNDKLTKNKNDDDEPLKKQARLSPFDHGYIAKVQLQSFLIIYSLFIYVFRRLMATIMRVLH